ncbi:MAG: YbaB/EbfC family nucleoid-associated protein [bacterium]|nr:YbaB/EbfC family nucleoid-associated protein [bacterium]
MLDKLQQINELRKMKAAVGEERATVEQDGISVTVNGSLMVESLSLNPDKSAKEQEGDLLNVINDANKKVQQQVAMKMKDMMQG